MALLELFLVAVVFAVIGGLLYRHLQLRRKPK
jgi:hypothetical protein